MLNKSHCCGGLQVKALPHLLAGTLKHLINDTDDEDDDLCEWTYFIDWEEKILHVEMARWNLSWSVEFKNLTSAWMEGIEAEATGYVGGRPVGGADDD